MTVVSGSEGGGGGGADLRPGNTMRTDASASSCVSGEEIHSIIGKSLGTLGQQPVLQQQDAH